MKTTIELEGSNNHGIPTFIDFINEAVRRFEVEKNEKNRLNAFLLDNSLVCSYQNYITGSKEENSNK